jgi:hypothetical protein
MIKPIIQITRDNETQSTDIQVLRDINMADMYKMMIDTVATISEVLLQDMDEIKQYKYKKAMISDLINAIEVGYSSKETN